MLQDMALPELHLSDNLMHADGAIGLLKAIQRSDWNLRYGLLWVRLENNRINNLAKDVVDKFPPGAISNVTGG